LRKVGDHLRRARRAGAITPSGDVVFAAGFVRGVSDADFARHHCGIVECLVFVPEHSAPTLPGYADFKYNFLASPRELAKAVARGVTRAAP
jgi:hypothetical protein